MAPKSFEWPVTPLTDDVWTASVPIRFAGVWFPHVMTTIRLADESLVLHSPCRFSSNIAADIATLGVVQHIIAPNWFHDLYLREYHEAYPQATIWGPSFLQRLKGQSLIRGILDGPTPWVEFSQYFVKGLLTFDETLFYHRATKTLIVADLLMNVLVPRDAPIFTRLVFQLSRSQNRLCTSPYLRLAITDRSALRQAAAQMRSWRPRNIIVGHGSPITVDASANLNDALDWLQAGCASSG